MVAGSGLDTPALKQYVLWNARAFNQFVSINADSVILRFMVQISL